jgi:hypothetical protein
MFNRRLLVAYLSLLTLITISCGVLSGLGATSTPVPPTATPTPASFAQEGHWEGVNPEVSFDVTSDGIVENFSIMIGGECDVQANAAFPIDDDHVLLIGELDEEGQPVDNSIVGTFDSPTTISGSFSTPWRCGSESSYTMMFLPEPLTHWDAEWQGP